jgi:glycosyltransferase involved in cell wall biosynthesis
MKDRPLLSFFVGCYNQEGFIREAIQGALDQTYSPLEVIICDDCSTDRTFDIAREMAAAYQGPHTIRLNRNEKNLGICGNVNRWMELARGELVFAAAGDDVSIPSRVQVTYDAWEQFDRRPTSICSSYTTISGDGTVLGPGGFRGDPNDKRPLKLLEGDLCNYLATREPAVCGCSHAWTPSLFKYFGPLKSDLEDTVLSFRSHAIGQILYIQEPLVKYRRHGANVSFFAGGDDSTSFAHREKRLRWVDEQTVRAYENMLGDIDVLQREGRLTAAECERLRQEALRIRNIYAVEREMMDGSVVKKLRTLAGAARQGNLKWALRLTPRLLPHAAYRSLYLLRNRIRFAARLISVTLTAGALAARAGAAHSVL